MKRKPTKRAISNLLVTTMLLLFLPINASATGGRIEVTNETELDAALESASDGTTIVFLNDITLADTDDNALKLTNGSSVTLDLNGFTLDRNCGNNYRTKGYAIEIDGGSTLTLTGDGVVTGARNKCRPKDGNDSEGGAVFVENGTFILESGSIENNGVSYFNVPNGGSPAETGFGGAVYVAGDGLFLMNGGAIQNNLAMGYYGGGVYVADGGVFTMGGGTISGNASSRTGCGVYAAEGATVSVSDPEQISGNYRIKLKNVSSGSYLSGETDPDPASMVNFAVWDSSITVVDETELDDALAAAADGAVIKFLNDIKLESKDDNALKLTNGNSVTLDLNGFTLDRNCGNGYRTKGHAIEIDGGSTLTLTGNGTVTGAKNKCRPKDGNNSEGGAVYVKNGIFILESGTIENNGVSYFNTANGGSVATTGFGGAVYVADGSSFVMNGGTIQNNTALGNCGGAVYVADGGAFTMDDGTITGNSSSLTGGGVYVADGGSFTATGGTVAENTAGSADSDVAAAEGATVRIVEPTVEPADEADEPEEPAPVEPAAEPADEPEEPAPVEPTVEPTDEPEEPAPVEPTAEPSDEPEEPAPVEPAAEPSDEPEESAPVESAAEPPVIYDEVSTGTAETAPVTAQEAVAVDTTNVAPVAAQNESSANTSSGGTADATPVEPPAVIPAVTAEAFFQQMANELFAAAQEEAPVDAAEETVADTAEEIVFDAAEQPTADPADKPAVNAAETTDASAADAVTDAGRELPVTVKRVFSAKTPAGSSDTAMGSAAGTTAATQKKDSAAAPSADGQSAFEKLTQPDAAGLGGILNAICPRIGISGSMDRDSVTSLFRIVLNIVILRVFFASL